VPAPQLRGPLLVLTDIPDMGRRATVTATGPPVRGYYGADRNPPVLATGTELLLKTGPVAEDGYDWYEAYFQAGPSGNQIIPESAWVAAGLTGQERTLMEIGPLRCPAVPTTVALLGSMTDLARRECLSDDSFEVHGVAENCYLDGIHAYFVEPAWLGGPFCQYRAIELGTNVSLPIHLPPSLLIPDTLIRGDLVRIVGHVNDPAAEDCTLVPTGEIESTDSQAALALQQAILACRSAFVVSELEVTGHIELANPFGF